jgi:Gpi18-like mannosyltransferase
MWKNMLLVVLLSLVSLGLFWFPFFLHAQTFWQIDFAGHGMETIVQNFDGLNFLIVAKSLYDPTRIAEIQTIFPTGNEPLYFAAHFPLFALVIRAWEVFVPSPYALLSTIIISNALLAGALYAFFVTTLRDKLKALALTGICLVFPARMLSTRAVGSNEPLFIALSLTSLALSMKKRHWGAAVAGALAVLTRSPGILLFGAYSLAFLCARESWGTKLRAYFPYLLMPLALLGLFGVYAHQYGDFFAYFHSGDNLHLFPLPFTIFSNTASWISGMWREDIIYLYVFYGVGIGLMTTEWLRSPRHFDLATLGPVMFAVLYGATLLFVSHRDLARYGLPLAPLALLGYAPLVNRKWLAFLLVLLLPIYLLGWQFVVANVQPINNWQALL